MRSSLKRVLTAAALLVSTQATLAAEPVKFGLCYDLTKIYVAAVPQVAQAVKDYADLLNTRGGLEGHPIEVAVQDHGNEPQRGIDCYERLKREGTMSFPRRTAAHHAGRQHPGAAPGGPG